MVLIAVVAWLVWPAATKSGVAPSKADAGTASASADSLVAPSDPTATGAIEITAAGAAMLAVRSKTYRRAFAGDHQVVAELPLGEYDVFASSDDGMSAHATVTVAAGATERIDLKLAALPGSVVLRGAVHDILGGTVPGADVWVDFTIVRTDGRGEFVTHALPGQREVRVRAAGYAETRMNVQLRLEQRVEVVLHPAASLRGVVINGDGTPSGGARVFAREMGRGLGDEVEVFADADGRFEIGGIRGGSFNLQASTATEIGFAEQITVAPASVRDIRIELGTAVAIFGRALAADGAPIANAKVTVERDHGVGSAVTDREGRYRLGPLPPGFISIQACADDHVCARTPDHFYAASPTGPVDLVLDAASTLRVRVVDRNGAPVSDAVVFLSDANRCDTNPEGECVFDHLRPRRAKVQATHSRAGQARDDVVDIGPGETRHTLHLVPGGVVRGTVRWDDGTPASNIEVRSGFLSMGGSGTRSGADGRYELVNVAPGYSRVRALLTEKSERDASEMFVVAKNGAGPMVGVDLQKGEVREGVDLVVRRETKSISGTVLDADGAPVASAEVGVMRETEMLDRGSLDFLARGAKAYSNADGTFTLDDISDGEHAIWSAAEGHARGVVRHVRAPAPNVTVKLPRGARIEGFVKDERGAPVTAFLVGLDSYGSSHRVRDAAGHFSFAGVPEGERKITLDGAAEGADGIASAIVAVKAGDTAHVNLVLKRGFTIVGRLVTSPGGTPIANAELWASGNGRYRRSTPSGRDGRFRIDGLSEGRVSIAGSDLNGDRDQWERTVGGEAIVDVGDIAVSPRRSDAMYKLPIEDDERVIAVDGRDVTALGARSIGAVIDEAPVGSPIEVRKDSGATRTIPSVAPKKR